MVSVAPGLPVKYRQPELMLCTIHWEAVKQYNFPPKLKLEDQREYYEIPKPATPPQGTIPTVNNGGQRRKRTGPNGIGSQDAPALAFRHDLAVLLAGTLPGEYAKFLSGIIEDEKSPTAVPFQNERMATPESMHFWDWEGIRWWFSDASPSSPIVQTLIMLLYYGELPDRLVSATREIFFVAQADISEAVTGQRLGWNIVILGSAGLDNQIAYYRNFAPPPYKLGHEMAHNLSDEIYGSVFPPQDSDFGQVASSGEPPPSEYAATDIGEDFAVSIEKFIQDPEWLKREHPKRYNVIRRILLDGSDSGKTG